MTAGLPGAGIGGLFYLASTIILPFRSLFRRLRGQPDTVTWGHQAHSGLIAVGIILGLWMAGWLLGFVVPQEMLTRGVASAAREAGSRKSVIPFTMVAFALGTLAFVLAGVEIAHHVYVRKPASARGRVTGKR